VKNLQLDGRLMNQDQLEQTTAKEKSKNSYKLVLDTLLNASLIP
jgi:hypothetical protein